MSKAEHTKEPWAVDADDYYTVCDVDSNRICSMIDSGMKTDTDESNAARIVACVNACAGLTNEQLEAGAVEKMREALQRLLRAYESDYQYIPSMDVKTSYETNSQAIAQARAVLAPPAGEK